MEAVVFSCMSEVDRFFAGLGGGVSVGRGVVSTACGRIARDSSSTLYLRGSLENLSDKSNQKHRDTPQGVGEWLTPNC